MGKKMAGQSNTKKEGLNGCQLCGINDIVKLDEHNKGKRHQHNLKKLETQEKEINGIFITGFLPGTDGKQLEALVKSYGKITDFYFNAEKCFLIVSFKDKKSADSILASCLMIGDRRLIVKRRRMKSQTFAPATFAPEDDPSLKKVDASRVVEILMVGGSLDDVLEEVRVPMPERAKFDRVMADLELLFKPRFAECRAHAFGSVRTGLCMKGSDVDIFLKIEHPEKGISKMSTMTLPEKLVYIGQSLMTRERSGLFGQVRPVARAKTPIIKFVHMSTGVSCDVSFKNSLGVANSDLIRHYIELDPRVYPYLMVIKFWAQVHDFSGCGRLTNYALVTLAAFYLQQLDPPVLPTVRRLQELCRPEEEVRVDGWLCSFSRDTRAVEPSRNTSTVLELLAGFFQYYQTLRIEELVICPLLGCTIPKTHFVNTDQLPEPMKSEYLKQADVRTLKVISDMCIQDPFELNHNLTVGTRTDALMQFTAHLKIAVDVFNEVSVAPDDKKLPTMSKIFSVKAPNVRKENFFRMTNTEMWTTIFADGYLSTGLFVDDTGGLEDAGEGTVTQKWFAMIYQLTMDFFSKIMKFDLDVEMQSASKVMKVGSPSDVHEATAATAQLNDRVIHARGCYRMWEGRRRHQVPARKPACEEAARQHCFQVEEAVSERLYKHYADTAPNEAPIVAFQCTLENVTDPPSVKFHFTDVGSQKAMFHGAMGYLRSRLPTLIEKYLKYKKQRARETSYGIKTEEAADESTDV